MAMMRRRIGFGFGLIWRNKVGGAALSTSAVHKNSNSINLFTAINQALHIALQSDPRYVYALFYIYHFISFFLFIFCCNYQLACVCVLERRERERERHYCRSKDDTLLCHTNIKPTLVYNKMPKLLT